MPPSVADRRRPDAPSCTSLLGVPPLPPQRAGALTTDQLRRLATCRHSLQGCRTCPGSPASSMGRPVQLAAWAASLLVGAWLLSCCGHPRLAWRSAAPLSEVFPTPQPRDGAPPCVIVRAGMRSRVPNVGGAPQGGPSPPARRLAALARRRHQRLSPLPFLLHQTTPPGWPATSSTWTRCARRMSRSRRERRATGICSCHWGRSFPAAEAPNETKLCDVCSTNPPIPSSLPPAPFPLPLCRATSCSSSATRSPRPGPAPTTATPAGPPGAATVRGAGRQGRAARSCHACPGLERCACA